jgi:glycosyltransferase involved in cell wall biosynthesis
MLLLILPLLFIKTKPDYVVIEPDVTALGIVTTLLLPKIIRPKIILDIRSIPVNISGLGGFFKNFFFSIAVHLSRIFFNGMTIITEMMREEVCQAFCIDPYKVGVWSSGVSTVLFNPANYDAANIKKAFGLEGKFVVFYHGVISSKRGIPQAIKAIQILDTYSDIVLFLLGREEDLDVKRLAQNLNVEKRVIMHKSVSYAEVPKYISLCDVGLVALPNLPDWRNQCPLNLLEYLSMKKPVIATDIPANRKILEKHKCGIYVKSANPEEIAYAILYAYKNRAKTKVWGALGRRIVEEKYTWDKVAEKFETYLFKL